MPSLLTDARSVAPRCGRIVFLTGLTGLGLALAAAGVLVVEHLTGVGIPGCGQGSPCATLAASRWGRIPGVNWPVSYLGGAWFAASLSAWIAWHGVIPQWFRLLAGVGALASAMFLGIMLGMHPAAICPYCVAAHAGNFMFVGALAWAPRPDAVQAGPRRAPVVVLGTFVLVSAGLALVDAAVSHEAATAAERQRLASQEEIVRAGRARVPTEPSPSPASAQPRDPQPPAAQPPLPAVPPLPPARPAVFTGRYRIGPEQAAIRIVMFTDYQCPDCRLIEPQIETVLARFPSVSVSIKHFPFCLDCNPHVAGANIHPNACWAARAAEAAGMLYGVEGFRRMHTWLFRRHGSFTNADLDQGLRELGFERERFITVMTGPETLRRVQADIEEAIALGLVSTPMIFVNGVELRGWRAPDALVRTVEGVAATNPPVRGPEADRPPLAGDKYVEDWRQQIQMAWPSRAQPWTAVGPDAPVRVTLFGDLLEPNCAEADRTIRNAIVGRSDVRYEFRYYPFDQTCNPRLPRTVFAGGCAAARAAEAAGRVGGLAAYWTMHDWILNNQTTFSESGAIEQARRMGLDEQAYVAALRSPEVSRTVENDADIGFRMQIMEIPRIYVNGKLVPRWRAPGGFVLERIIEEAGRQPAPPVQVVPALPQIPGLNAPLNPPPPR